MWPFNRIKSRIYYEMLRRFKPEVVGYPPKTQGEKNEDTRISNVTHISNKKNITIGDNVFIGHFNYIDGFDKVSIGNGCQITNYVSVLTHSSHNSIRLYGENYNEHWGKGMKGLLNAPVQIGEYCFIGPHSVIMPGTILGKGCVVSAFSFVSGTFEDFSIIRGIPAKLVGSVSEPDRELLDEYPRLKNLYFDKH
jgi:acetyltransferase-like isoleucine patch superfamily enzyme